MLLAANDYWYTSGAFWGPASGVVAVVIMGAVGALVAWRASIPKRLLTYRLLAPTRLVSSESLGPSHANLLVRYQGVDLSDPYIVTLQVDSRSRKDIRSTDFDEEKPLTFDMGTRIIAVVGSDPAGPGAKTTSVTERTVKLAKGLIRRGPLLRLTLLTDGLPDVSCDNPLADVKVESYREPRQIMTLGASGAGVAGIIIGWFILPACAILVIFTPLPSLGEALTIGALAVTLPLSVLIGLALGNRARTKRGRLAAQAGQDLTMVDTSNLQPASGAEHSLTLDQ
jgi:hypothetical protein